MQTFRIDVPQTDLDDLAARLAQIRWPDEVENGDWRYGTNLAFLKQLAGHWVDGFDWRAQEARLNALPQIRAKVGGHDIHFVHARGRGPNPLPLVITHGWPSCFAEFARIIPLLTDPAAHGGDAEDAFDVVAPSLPGYGFSARPAQPGITSGAVADLWVQLMTETLGYNRFVAHGGDIGASVTNHLGRRHGARVKAIHTMQVPVPTEIPGPALSESERAWFDVIERWKADEGAYSHQQRTRPQTLAYGLNDSPTGLAAWIVEKWRSWSDCGGDVLSRFTLDELLTNISIYWFTQTIASSVRMYYETAHGAPFPAGRIETPTRVFLTREEVARAPLEYAQRFYADLSFGEARRGGHFLAAEEPALLVDDIREYFRAFR